MRLSYNGIQATSVRKVLADTISVAIGKAKMKNGRAIFAIVDFNELDTAIKNSGLDGYFKPVVAIIQGWTLFRY